MVFAVLQVFGVDREVREPQSFLVFFFSSQTELTIPSYEQNTKVGPIGVQLGSNRGTKIIVFRPF